MEYLIKTKEDFKVIKGMYPYSIINLYHEGVIEEFLPVLAIVENGKPRLQLFFNLRDYPNARRPKRRITYDR